MFDRENVGVRISGMTPEKPLDHDDKEIPMVRFTCEVNPLTPELAGEVHDIVRRTLYTTKDVEVNNLVAGCTFNLELPPQEIVVKTAPDLKKPTFTITEAKIEAIRAKRSKKSTAWVLEFSFRCSPATPQQLALMHESYLKQRWFTFALAEADLFSEVGKEERATRRAAAADADGDNRSAATH